MFINAYAASAGSNSTNEGNDMAQRDTAQVKLDAFGIDAVCERIADMQTMAAIAGEVGVNAGTLSRWLADDAQRHAYAREARRLVAQAWDEKAEAEIAAATDSFSLSRARELAHHYRWRASKIAPREYGDRLAVGGADELPAVKVEATLSPAEAYSRLIRGE